MFTRYKLDLNKYIPNLLIYISYWLMNHRENKDFQQQQQQQQQQQLFLTSWNAQTQSLPLGAKQ